LRVVSSSSMKVRMGTERLADFNIS